MIEHLVVPSEHFVRLGKAYHAVGDRTWAMEDFLEANLESSRGLYLPESLLARRPRPKELEVFAAVAGLPFRPEFADALVRTQQDISSLLGERLHYSVAPANLGVEFVVFKWPTDSWNPEWLPVVQGVLASIRQPAFRFEIRGVQINPDGCIVAKGFDEDGVLFRIRAELVAQIHFLPAKQSGWAHVPMGRILEPLGAERFAKLARFIAAKADEPIAATEIGSMKMVHETRWYMEEKTIVAEYPLLTGAPKGRS